MQFILVIIQKVDQYFFLAPIENMNQMPDKLVHLFQSSWFKEFLRVISSSNGKQVFKRYFDCTVVVVVGGGHERMVFKFLHSGPLSVWEFKAATKEVDEMNWEPVFKKS